MKLREAQEEKISDRAALIPYLIEDGKIFVLFMRPSDPAYGGPLFQIAKGGIDPGEKGPQAAVREADEELGLKKDNLVPGTLKKVTSITQKGFTGNYKMHVYKVQCKSRKLGKHGFETGEVKWMEWGEFVRRMRKSQLPVVVKAYKSIGEIN